MTTSDADRAAELMYGHILRHRHLHQSDAVDLLLREGLHGLVAPTWSGHSIDGSVLSRFRTRLKRVGGYWRASRLCWEAPPGEIRVSVSPSRTPDGKMRFGVSEPSGV